MKTKVCRVCFVEKMVEDMHHVGNICPSCKIEELTTWMRNNPKKLIASRERCSMRYREENREMLRKKARDYYSSLSPEAKKARSDRQKELYKIAKAKKKNRESYENKKAKDALVLKLSKERRCQKNNVM